MGNQLSSLNPNCFHDPPVKRDGVDPIAEVHKASPQRKTYGPPLQKYNVPGDPKGVTGTWRYGNNTDQSHWVGTCWYFIWASCVNHRHPHDVECQKARFFSEGLLTGSERLYADNMYSKGCFDPVLGDWGFYGKLGVTERRAFTTFFNARKEEIQRLEEQEGSKYKAQEKMMSNDRAWKRSKLIKDKLTEQANQIAEYFTAFTDNQGESRADRYLKQAKAMDTLRIQKAQMLMAGGCSEEEAIERCTPLREVPEAAWIAGGKSLQNFFKAIRREAWLANNNVDSTSAQLSEFAKTKDLAAFPLTNEEAKAQAARDAAAEIANGTDAATATRRQRERVTSMTKQQERDISAAFTGLMEEYSPRIIDWIENPSTNPVMIIADMLRTGTTTITPRDSNASKVDLVQREMEALLCGPSVGEDATTRGRLENFQETQGRIDRATNAPQLYFDKDGNYESGKQPWEKTSRSWIEVSDDKYDPDYENWMRARAKQLWNRFYGDNFPSTLEAIKEICYNADARRDFFEKWDGLRLALEDERDHKERYKGQPFKYQTLPTPGLDFQLPGSFEFESRFGTAVTEGHPYLPGAYWTYPPVDWSEEQLHPDVPFQVPPGVITNLEDWLGEEE